MDLYIKDSTKDLSEIKTSSVNLVLTSPPYFDIIDYGHKDQLGKGLTYAQFFNKLSDTLNECIRVLKSDGLIVLIVSDIRVPIKLRESEIDRPRIIPFHCDIINYFNKMGMEFYQQTIWQQTSSKKGEKGKIVYGANGEGFYLPPYLCNDLNFDYILVFRKPGLKRSFPPKKERITDEDTRIPKEFAYEWSNPIWKIDFEENEKQKNHPATFPAELASRLIKLYSVKNDVVLDPFCGTCTTLIEAHNLNRYPIGYEVNEEFTLNYVKKYMLNKELLKVSSNPNEKEIIKYFK
jgi:modification methylase